MFMKILYNIADYIQKLNKKDFEKNLVIFLSIIIISSLGSTYFIYNKSNDLIEKIRLTKKLSLKTMNIIKLHEKMQKEEDKLQKMLEQEKEFDIQTYFEKFCSEQNITPEGSGWETITQELTGSDKFDEISLSVTFKNETTQKLVSILETLNKKNIVYIKELIIKNENKKILFDITIATKKLKRSI